MSAPCKLYVYHDLNLMRLDADRREAEHLIGLKAEPDRELWVQFSYRELTFVFRTPVERARAIARLNQAQEFTAVKFVVHPFTNMEGIVG
jgi:hypothetical protein